MSTVCDIMTYNAADYMELVKQAQRGDRESMNRLVGEVRLRLRRYVYRLTLREDLTQDLVQESILEMFKVFGKLENVERFWPWLYGIALNKVRSHYGKEWRRNTVSMGDMDERPGAESCPDGLAESITAEWKQIVVRSMQELEPRHRAVLTMRCYDQMQYSEISKAMKCSELGVRALFCRAKRSLAKKLGQYGLGKGSMLASLILFGKLTATSEAAAAEISVTAATLKAGTAASLAAMVTSKAAVVTVATASVIAVGSVTIGAPDKNDTITQFGQTVQHSQVNVLEEQRLTAANSEECWYFYPADGNGAVVLQVKSDGGDWQSYKQWHQNQQGNYYQRNNTNYIENYRMWAADLSVLRLPTDSEEFRDFLTRVDGKIVPMTSVDNYNSGLLVLIKQDHESVVQKSHEYDVSDEEFFRYDATHGARKIDNRDAMHKRGWTYFKINGQIGEEVVRGSGRMPFVQAASTKYQPWLKLQVGDLLIIDADSGATVRNSSGGTVAAWLGGSFFEGLGRPWMGLHTIDSVRRDAARQRLWFNTIYRANDSKAEVTVHYTGGRIVYAIDMKRDVIDEILFFEEPSLGQEIVGKLSFEYLQDVENVSGNFIEPTSRSYRQSDRSDKGMLWLIELAQGTLGQ